VIIAYTGFILLYALFYKMYFISGVPIPLYIATLVFGTAYLLDHRDREATLLIRQIIRWALFVSAIVFVLSSVILCISGIMSIRYDNTNPADQWAGHGQAYGMFFIVMSFICIVLSIISFFISRALGKRLTHDT